MIPAHAYYWTDRHGLVHILLDGSYVMACNGLYRSPQTRETNKIPTCFECIAADAQMVFMIPEGSWQNP